jgi:tRNA pseudouridine38-40 synthase
MRRVRITVSYDGTDYHGWQIQPSLPTIQGTLEDVAAQLEKTPVQVTGSGRTDAGVHALAQVAAFSIDNPIPIENLRRAMNRQLPPAIRILGAADEHPDFHPRYDAVAKTYEYRIFRGEVCPPFEWRYIHHYPYRLDHQRMIDAAGVFEGEYDFSAFAAADHSDAEGKSKVRTVYSSSLLVEGNRMLFRVRGRGFLKHMVRNLAGALIEVGKGNLDADAIREFLNPGYPRKAGPTAPAKGLFLMNVEYPNATGRVD